MVTAPNETSLSTPASLDDSEPILVSWHAVQSEARGLLHRDELQSLHQLNPWALAESCVATWAVILLSIWAWAATRHPAVGVLAFCAIATRQHALNTIVHEGAHWGFTKKRLLNDWLCDFFIAAPHLIMTSGYREKHMLHHTKLGNHEFDYERKARYLISGSGFFRWTANALLGGGLLGAAKSYLPMIFGRSTDVAAASNSTKSNFAIKRSARYLAMVVATQGALFAYCWWLGSPLAYFGLWILPLTTLTLYINMLRVMSEHQPFPYAAAGIENVTDDMPPFTRTIPAGFVERCIFSPLFFGYHHEHHLFPQVPFSNLPNTHALLKARGYYAAHPEFIAPSYFYTLRRLIFPHAG